MTVVAELAGGAVQHVETGRGPDPQMPRLILEDGADVVAGEGGRVRRFVMQRLQQLAGVIQAAEPRIGCANPERPGGILQHARDVARAERAQVLEAMMLALPALESRLGADQIGRASCRERGEISVRAVSVKKKLDVAPCVA